MVSASRHPESAGNMWKHHPLQRTRLISGSFLAKFMHSCKMFGTKCQMKCCSLKFRERGLLFERKSQVLKAWHFPISFQGDTDFEIHLMLVIGHWKSSSNDPGTRQLPGESPPFRQISGWGSNCVHDIWMENDGNVHLDGFAYHLHWSWANPL